MKEGELIIIGVAFGVILIVGLMLFATAVFEIALKIKEIRIKKKEVKKNE